MNKKPEKRRNFKIKNIVRFAYLSSPLNHKYAFDVMKIRLRSNRRVGEQ